MATEAEIPPELSDLIIDYLHGQKRALGTCGLVSKAWLRSSRHHLFASVRLHGGNWPAFLRLLESPFATFAESISSLEVLQTGHHENFNELVARLPPFPAVRRLQLSWTFILRITGRFATPYQVALLVSNFAQLEELSVDTMFLDNDGIPEVVPAVPRNLKLVRFSSPPGNENSINYFLSWLHVVERPMSMRLLELNTLGTPSLPAANGLIHALGADLQGLDLNFIFRVTPADISTHIDLSRNTRLQSLTIHLNLTWSSYGGHGGAPAWVLLLTLHAKIATLTIVLIIYGVGLLDKLDWAYLTTALGTLPQLSALKRLHFIVRGPFAMDGVEDAIRARLPAQDARGLVDVSAECDTPSTTTIVADADEE
ncbi:hypothetical protein C8R44DRAFT_736016 [Mycena epipterygia]|nr:hypothetical protein C8R44DRAFT_736016 [Mycena epipterygia]